MPGRAVHCKAGLERQALPSPSRRSASLRGWKAVSPHEPACVGHFGKSSCLTYYWPHVLAPRRMFVRYLCFICIADIATIQNYRRNRHALFRLHLFLPLSTSSCHSNWFQKCVFVMKSLNSNILCIAENVDTTKKFFKKIRDNSFSLNSLFECMFCIRMLCTSDWLLIRQNQHEQS